MDRPADARHRPRRHASRPARLGDEVRESHARRAGLAARPDLPETNERSARGRRPADQSRHDLGQRTARHQQDDRHLRLRDASRRSSLFWLGTRRKDALVPGRASCRTPPSRASAFVRNQVIMQTMGPDGLGYLPYLTALFFFIFFSNITEIIPAVQFPANARFAMPMALALATWVIFNVVGVVKQGPATT